MPEWQQRFGWRRAGLPCGGRSGARLSEVLRAGAEEQAVVLAVDDAQWLDRESLLALVAVAARPGRVAGGADAGLAPFPPRDEVDELRSHLGRDIGGTAVTVGALGPAPLRALARRLLPGYSEVELDRLVRRVVIDSAGTPLLAVELFRAVALGLDLGTTTAAWPEPAKTLDQSLPGDLPDAVVAAIRIGYRRLSSQAQRVLAAAAVLGDRVPAARLVRALDAAPAAVHEALDEFEWQRWLVAEPRGYGFVARIVRQIIERDMLTPGQRNRLLQNEPRRRRCHREP